MQAMQALRIPMDSPQLGHFSRYQAASALIGAFSPANSKDREQLCGGFVEDRSCNDADWASLEYLFDGLKLFGRDLCLA